MYFAFSRQSSIKFLICGYLKKYFASKVLLGNTQIILIFIVGAGQGYTHIPFNFDTQDELKRQV